MKAVINIGKFIIAIKNRKIKNNLPDSFRYFLLYFFALQFILIQFFRNIKISYKLHVDVRFRIYDELYIKQKNGAFHSQQIVRIMVKNYIYKSSLNKFYILKYNKEIV